MIVKLGEGVLNTPYGRYREVLFYDGQKETIVMILGDVAGHKDVLCRVHSACIYGHYFSSSECDCREQMKAAQKLIQTAGKGVIILLDQEGKGNGHFALMKSTLYKNEGSKQAGAYEKAGFSRDNRDFRCAAKVLKALHVLSVKLITDNPAKTNTLEDHGVSVNGIISTGK
ncbi:GTP cyclohydrolase [Roseivirga sp. BDSF3-8]|uniref:GTP cyclohydrolase n=1 Tax=Roseivirga sp. BDSF3-8 TaxID=3241598 RepID=UPI003531A510